jgi:hypothetical protein
MINIPQQQIPGVYQRRVGDIVVMAISDGFLDGSMQVLRNISVEDATAILAALWPYDGERVANIRKQPADPTEYQPVRGHEWQSGRFTPAQHGDLLPKHEDFCFQRRSRPKQIDDETKYQSDKI